MRRLLVAAMMVACGASGALAQGQQPVPVVAAENFYGDVAKQIGGPDVSVTSILTNPDQDPHLFEASASVARAMSGARVVIVNGVDYDPWATKLLGAEKGNDRVVLDAGQLTGHKPGDNPHIWYAPATMRAVARALTDTLSLQDPVHAAAYAARYHAFDDSLKPIEAREAALKARLAGTPVTATEPVFGYVFQALGMTIRNEPFQLAVMNNTEPSASDVAAFETDLKTHQVKLMVYNSQASDKVAEHMEKLAKQSHVPVIAVTETEPAGKAYQAWLTGELNAVDHALPR